MYRIAFISAQTIERDKLIRELETYFESLNKNTLRTFKKNQNQYLNQYFSRVTSDLDELMLTVMFSDQFKEKQNTVESPNVFYDFEISDNSLIELISEGTALYNRKNFSEVWSKLMTSALENYWDLVVYVPLKFDESFFQEEIDEITNNDRELRKALTLIKDASTETSFIDLPEVGIVKQFSEIKQLLIDKNKV